jgi:hypothetical protein
MADFVNLLFGIAVTPWITVTGSSVVRDLVKRTSSVDIRGSWA